VCVSERECESVCVCVCVCVISKSAVCLSHESRYDNSLHISPELHSALRYPHPAHRDTPNHLQ